MPSWDSPFIHRLSLCNLSTCTGYAQIVPPYLVHALGLSLCPALVFRSTDCAKQGRPLFISYKTRKIYSLVGFRPRCPQNRGPGGFVPLGQSLPPPPTRSLRKVRRSQEGILQRNTSQKHWACCMIIGRAFWLFHGMIITPMPWRIGTWLSAIPCLIGSLPLPKLIKHELSNQ